MIKMNEKQKKLYEEVISNRRYDTASFAKISKTSEAIAIKLAEDFDIDFEEAIEVILSAGANAFYEIE